MYQSLIQTVCNKEPSSRRIIYYPKDKITVIILRSSKEGCSLYRRYHRTNIQLSLHCLKCLYLFKKQLRMLRIMPFLDLQGFLIDPNSKVRLMSRLNLTKNKIIWKTWKIAFPMWITQNHHHLLLLSPRFSAHQLHWILQKVLLP